MRLSSLRVFRVLLEGGLSVSRLAEKTGLSPSAVSKAVKELEERGLVERRDRKISLAPNPATEKLKALAGKFSLEKILKEKKEQIILELTEEKTLVELQKSVNLSEVQTSRLLKELREAGAIFKKNSGFALNESLKPFAEELKKIIQLKRIEPGAVLLFSNKFKLKKLPPNARAKGSLTAFSRFAEFGVPYAVVNAFYVEPEHEVTVEEVFVHALAASETKKDTAMCLIFHEKNKDKMDFKKLVELAKEFKVNELLFDCLAFLQQKKAKDQEKFLPWSEFQSLASSYDLAETMRKSFSSRELEALLFEIGRALDDRLTIFLVGGCALSLQGIKATTKDIDIVVRDGGDFSKIKRVLTKLGFKQVTSRSPSYKKMNPSAIFEKAGKPRANVFTKIVCNALTLSEKMAERSIKRRYGKLSVNFLKPEDIILFKAITEREGDLEDIAAIIRNQNPDWTYFLKEIDSQCEKSSRLFCLNVLDTVELLEEKEKIVVPIKQRLVSLCLEKGILFLAEKPVSVKEIVEKIDFPETTIRNKIRKLVKEKRLAKVKGKPFRVIVTSFSH